MRRRWMLLAELIGLIGLSALVGAFLTGGPPRPPGAIDLKVQMKEARDRVFLVRAPDGQTRFVVDFYDGSRAELSPDEFARRLVDDHASRSWLEVLLNVSSPIGFLWVAVGLLGQVLFTGRMVVQWLASERSRRSVVPPAFWWMSLLGSTMLLIYFLWRRDPVGVLGQSLGWFIYVRNLWLIYGEPRPQEGA